MTATTSVRKHQDGSDGGSTTTRIPHRKAILVAITLIVVGALSSWLIAFSSVFGVRTVQVRGAQSVSAAYVLAAAHVIDATPLVRLDTGGIRRRVQALPEIASASVTRTFPSTVTITVTERVAIGVVRARSGFLLVDRTGDQFRKVALRPARLPLFVVPNGTDARTTGGAVASVAAALSAGLRARIASIQALDPNAITLLLKDGRVVHWAGAERSADKARVLPALLRQRGTQFDLTNPDLPFSR